MESGFECQYIKVCEKNGLVGGECVFENEPRQNKVDDSANTYLAPTNIIGHPTNEQVYARLEVLVSNP